MTDRHFAFFRLSDGTYIRELKGPVQAYVPKWWHWNRTTAMIRWATQVSQPQDGEVGLDVTHIGWPVGDFCYSTLDLNRPKPLLDWGPPRHYIELVVATMEVIVNLETHRPLHRSAVPGQAILDITGTWLEQYHGNIFGHLVRRGNHIVLESADAVRQLPAAVADTDWQPIMAQKVYANRASADLALGTL